jgi:uncharacterized membrane protein (DUF4010 family)
VLTAVLIGAAIGLERQWSGHASGAHAHFGGIRTLTLLGGLGGVTGSMFLGAQSPIAIVLIAAASLLVVAGYAAASRTDVDATTEVAALMVLAAGFLAGSGQATVASALAAGTVLLLVEKTRLHDLVRKIDDASLRASARFAAMACIVLPLLPEGPYGPFGAFRPRELWAIVLFFSGISFLGWIARRLTGPQRGIVITGLLGGIISSTSVTLQFARDSRRRDLPGAALAAGAVGACSVMLLRVTLATAVLNPALALRLLRYTVPSFALGMALLLLLWRSDGKATNGATAPSDSPLQLRAALQMTLMFQLVLLAIAGVRARFGAQALITTSVLVGLTHLDALTLSLARTTVPAGGVDGLALALASGIVSNTLVKLALALVIGRGTFRNLTVLTLGAMALLIVVLFWW